MVMSSRSHSVEDDDEIEEDDDDSSEPRVSKWNESEAIEAAIRAKKNESPQSRNGFENPDDISLTELKLLQERLDTFVDPKEPKSDAEVKKDRAKFLRKYKVDPAFNPPYERLLLHRDISRNAMANEPREPYEVPVYSDLGNAREKFKKDFRYITQNVARPRIWPEPLNRFKYRCECDGPCTTAACRCFEINSLANKSPIGMKNGKIDIGDPACDIGCYALMCCGPACGCPAECPNRAENMVMKNKLEVFKRDKEIGFGVRTLNNVAFGELVCEFVGEVMDQSSFSRDSHNWAMEIARRNQKTLRDDDTKLVLEGLRQLTDCDLSDRQWIQVKSVKTYIYMIDPSRKGNLARFFSHGCWPNLQLVRVISNYAAIQHHRIFFYAAHAIPAGSELFFHYGKEFGNRLPCRCGTPLCFKEKLLKSFTRKQMVEMMTDIHRHWKRIAKEKEDKCDDSTAQRSASLPSLGIANNHLGDEDEPHPASEPPLDFSRFASSRKKARATSIDEGEGQTETLSASPTGSDDVITLSSDGTSDEDKPIDVITIDDSIEEQTAQPNEPVHEKQTSSNDDDKAVEKEKTKEKMQLNPSIIRGSQGEKQPQKRLIWYKDCKISRPPPLMKPRRNTAATAKKKTAAAEVSKATTQSKETTMNTVGASRVGVASLRKPHDATTLFEEATGSEETPQPSPRTTAEGHSPLFDSAVAYLGDSVETEDAISQEPVEEAPKPRTEATVGDHSTTMAEETAGGEVPAPKSRTTTERTRATAERKRATAERKRATAGRDATAPKSRSAAGRDRATVGDHSTIMAPVGQVKSRNDGTGTEEPIAAGAPVTPSSLGLQGSSADAEAGHPLRLPCKSARPKSLERLLREICRPPSMAVCRNPRPDSVIILNTNRYGGRKYTAREIEEYEKTMTSKTKETDSGGDEARVDESSIQETGEATAENSEATAQAITDTTVGASWVADTSLNKPHDATALIEEVKEIQETPQPAVMATAEDHSPLFDSAVADLDDFVETKEATAQEPPEELPQPSPEDTAEGLGSIVEETAGGEATAPKSRATSENEKATARGHNTIVAPEPVVEERLISESAEEQEEEDAVSVSKKEELTVAKEATPTAGPEAPLTGKTVATPISCNPANPSPATDPLRQPKTASPRHSPPPKKHKMIEGIKNARRRSGGPKPSESTISKNPIVEEVAEATSQPMATAKEEMATDEVTAEPRVTDEEEMATAKLTAPVATEPTPMEVEIVVLDEAENDEPQIDSGEVPVLAPVASVASSPDEPEDAVAHPPDLERELSPLALVDLAEAERDPSPEVLSDDDDIPTDPRLTAYEDSRDRPYRDVSSSAPKDDNYPTQCQWDDDGIDDDGRSSREGPETDQTLDDFERELQVRCWAGFAHQGQKKVRQEGEYGRRSYGGSAGNGNDSCRRDYRNQDVRTRPSERQRDLSCRRKGYDSWCYGEERDDRYHRGERGHSDFRGSRSYDDGRFGYGQSMEYERMDGGYRSQDRRPLEETTYSDYESGGLGDGDGRAYGRNGAFYETGGSGYGQSMEYEEMGGGYRSQDHRPREETTYRRNYGSGGLGEGGERAYGRNDAFYETGDRGYGQFIDTHHERGRELSSYQDRDQGGHFTYDYHPQNYEDRDRSQFCGRHENLDINYGEQRGGGRRGSRRLPVRREDGGRTTGWRNETRNRRRPY